MKAVKSSTSGARESGRPPLSERQLSTDVRIWKVSKVRSKKAPYQLRWTVAGVVKAASFATATLADSRRSELWSAMQRGEPFCVETGLPASEVRAAEARANVRPDPSWWQFAREFVGLRWRDAAAKTREGFADSFATVALAMSEQGMSAPPAEDLRLAMRWAVVPRNHETDVPEALAEAMAWLVSRSFPISRLTDARVLNDVQYRLSHKLCGSGAANDTYQRRRRSLNTALEYAVQVGYLDENPLTSIKRGNTSATDAVDPRVLVNTVQGAQLLTAVSYVGSVHRNRGRRLVAFFGCLLHAAMRPAEAVGLRHGDCDLPKQGWGKLLLEETRPVSGKTWTNSGERHDLRGLKARAVGSGRPVPIPPVLVQLLRSHIDEFGVAKDGRVFHNERGDVLGTSSYWRVWQEARPLALPPDKAVTPLAQRPYDLRHTCITNWLNAGVPPAEVARRVGNTPEVIHRRYEGCIDGHDEINNQKIERAMGWV